MQNWDDDDLEEEEHKTFGGENININNALYCCTYVNVFMETFKMD